MAFVYPVGSSPYYRTSDGRDIRLISTTPFSIRELGYKVTLPMAIADLDFLNEMRREYSKKFTN
jgi:hypothetical protein